MDTNQVVVSRGMYRQEAFNNRYPDVEKTDLKLYQKIRSECYCSRKRLWKFVTTVVPIIGVMRNYKWRQYIPGDIMAGLTVAIMHIPQGLGFGILASLKPIHGLYTSLWPVLFYLLFGTSTHVSFGTNAVICLLVAAITSRQEESFATKNAGGSVLMNSSFIANSSSSDELEEAMLQYRVGIATATAFLVGAILLGMGILRLGFITLYLSDSFISGFTTGAAVHIATSQVPKMLAIDVGGIQGVGKIVRTYIAIFSNITNTSVPDFLISVVSFAVLMLVKECINERFKSKMKMPVPIDLIVVIVGTVISHFARLKEVYGVTIVGEIPPGIPTPVVPPMREIGDFATDAFVTAILIFAFTIAIAKTLAKEYSYEIDDNQELVAYGLCNLISSFLLCFPSCIAPPRTMLLSSMGAKTTFSGIFTAVILFLVIMAIGPLFESLPVSILAAMIVVALKGLFMQVLHLKLYWRVNIFDFISWLGTFFSVVLIDLDIGLAVGVGVSAFTVIIQSQFAKGYLLGKANGDDLYTNMEKTDIGNVSGVKIFRFEASLYYATAEIFRSNLYSKTFDPKKILKAKAKSEKPNEKNNENTEKGHTNRSFENGSSGNGDVAVMSDSNSFAHPELGEPINHVIIDCRPMSYIDIAGINTLRQVIKEMNMVDVTVFLYGCSGGMIRALEGAYFFDTVSRDSIFLDIHDAIKAINFTQDQQANIDTRF